jgi:predicted Zn-dependent protease
MVMTRWPTACAISLILLTATLIALADGPRWSEQAEKEIGDKAAAEFEADVKIADNPELQARVDGIVARLSPHAARPNLPYVTKILEDPDVNAFSIPGGHIYITTAALEMVQSDDELAAILAHEMGHNCYQHGLILMRKNARYTNTVLLAALAAALSGASREGLANWYTAAQLVRIGVITGYSQDMEHEADAHAVRALAAAGYNPVGMLTFMETLANEAARRPSVNLGILRTHPTSRARVEAIAAQIEAMGLPIDRRAVTKWGAARATVSETDRGPVAEVKLADHVIVRMAVEAGKEQDAADRANQAADRINEALRAGLVMFQVTFDGSERQGTVYARGRPLFSILPADAALDGKSPIQAAETAAQELKMVLFEEKMSWVS